MMLIRYLSRPLPHSDLPHVVLPFAGSERDHVGRRAEALIIRAYLQGCADERAPRVS